MAIPRKRAHDEQIEMQRSAGGPHDGENIIIDGFTHLTEVLYTSSKNSLRRSLAVDYEYNYLYIAVVDAAPVILNLNTNEHISYRGSVKCAQSLTVDQKTHDVYIGTDNGIYKYKPSSGEEHRVRAAGVNVWHVYYNRVLYYTDNSGNGHSDELVNMQHNAHVSVIDDDDVTFFRTDTGLYSRQRDNGRTKFYYNGFVNSLAVDRHGMVYFANDDGIYEIIKYNASYKKVVSVAKPRAIAFDKDNNMIYNSGNRVYRLKPKVEINMIKTMDIMKQLETKLDVFVKFASHHQAHVEMEINMENYFKRKIKKMSQKIEKVETDQVKVLDSLTKAYTLITDIGVEIIENCETVKEQVILVQ